MSIGKCFEGGLRFSTVELVIIKCLPSKEDVDWIWDLFIGINVVPVVYRGAVDVKQNLISHWFIVLNEVGKVRGDETILCQLPTVDVEFRGVHDDSPDVDGVEGIRGHWS